MTGQNQEGNQEICSSERQLQALAEQLKTPFFQIARLGELANLTGTHDQCLKNIETTAEAALRFIDGYLLSSELLIRKQELELEPVAVSSVLQDAAHRLYKLAKQYDCDLQVHLSGKYPPVMAHRFALETAMISLGHTLIESQRDQSVRKRSVITLGAHRSQGGTVAGIFTNMEGLSDKMLVRATELVPQARQPLGSALHGNGAGVFIADSILAAMSTKLRVATHNHLPGFAATFSSTMQLSLV